MTPEQSRTLKPGDRVGFDGYADDIGTVQTTNSMYLRIIGMMVIVALPRIAI